MTTTILDTFQAIETRRSVKHYDPSVKLTVDEIKKLMELTLLSPTSFNMQNWRFVVVDEQAQKEAICAAAWNQAQVKEASHVVLICADLKAWGQQPERYWKDAPEAVQQVLVPMIPGFYKDNELLQRDEAMRSVGIASQTLMLAARAMGYDSCPLIGFDPVKVGELVKLPQDHVIGMMVVVGKALKPANVRGGQLPMDDVVTYNTF